METVRLPERGSRSGTTPGGLPALAALALCAALCVSSSRPAPAVQEDKTSTPASTLDETRLTLSKWIETQQIISKERKDWQQGKEILLRRVELIQQEVAAIEEKIQQAEAGVAEANRKRDEALARNEELKRAGTQLVDAVTAMEGDVRRLFPAIPQPLQEKVQPLYQRVPQDPAASRISAAERFQSVLGILNEINKANNEITVSYEVHDLGGGRPTEVKALYVGLAQAYYVSGQGEAGIGRPEADGWKWEPSAAVATDVLTALEILQGKHTPAFVPLLVRIQ